jgi:hypothetical protein
LRLCRNWIAVTLTRKLTRKRREELYAQIDYGLQPKKLTYICSREQALHNQSKNMARVTKNSSFHHSIFSQTLDPPLYDFSWFSLLSQQSIMVFPQFFFLSKFPFLSLSLLYLSVASCNYKKLNGTSTILVPFFFFM